ncbi:Piso0_003266 [Millerozyma farinosa CBS 7064]|uniref:Piso0_003266 protein n=1 Tax=Pichia sorbitophila (strain ATCC MYA-4447 / BCRC 22081 / CBS 7064 / NBRC 10061 / NRRL Y-12695) TaxID=559304 RepID=G8YIL9_PICSO|nr:Piso0_003266 [Millerozyma farinosa CBS 7064]CCE80929.1 Piso0_003266 [Millerozyma farinosa CBS 7064]
MADALHHGALLDSSFDTSIDKMFTNIIENLERKKNSLTNTLDECITLQNMLRDDHERPVYMIHLGGDYFCEMTQNDAQRFVTRKTEMTSKLLSEFNSKIQSGKKARDELSQLEHSADSNVSQVSETNSEGFIDIVEELDEDGSVKSAKLNNKPFEDISYPLPSSNQKPKNPNQSKECPSETAVDYDREKTPRSAEDFPNKVDEIENESGHNKFEHNDEQIKELLEDMEIAVENNSSRNSNNINIADLLERIDNLNIEREDKFKLKEICVEETNKMNNVSLDVEEEKTDSRQATRDSSNEKSAPQKFDKDKINNPRDSVNISPDDLIELEIISDDLNNLNDESAYSDNEEWDYVFSDEEEEEEDSDDYADDYLFGNKKMNLIPSRGESNKSALNERLWEQVLESRNKLREKSSELQIPKNEKKKQKSVRFAENLEIKEIENVSEEIRNSNVKYERKSRFKQARLQSKNLAKGKSSSDMMAFTSEHKDNKVNESSVGRNESSISQDTVGKESESVLFDVVEKSSPSSNIPEDISQTLAIDDASKTTHETKSSTVIPSSKEGKSDLQMKDINLDYKSLQNDLEAMVQAYNLGFYEDDISTSGPLVSQLKDFEELNKYVEAYSQNMVKESPTGDVISSDEQAQNSSSTFERNFSEHEEEHNAVSQACSEELKEDPVLTDIKENEPEIEDCDIEQNVIDQEVKISYAKMKQRLLAKKSDESREKEFEPIDESGNNVRISRFKASKIGRLG